MTNESRLPGHEWRTGGGDHARSVAALESAIVQLGLDVPRTLARMADALSGLTAEGTREKAQRLLALEWIGAVDQDHAIEPMLSDENLRTMLTRRVAMDQLLLLTVPEVAVKAACSVTEIESDVRNGFLWGYRLNGETVLPKWQFLISATGPLRVISEELPAVIRCIPEDALPSMVSRLMCSEDPYLQDGAVRRTPRDHLLADGSPWPVVRSLLLFLEGSVSRFPDVVLAGSARNKETPWA